MAWYNPATWTPVDAAQDKFGQSKRALNSFQGSSQAGPRFSNPFGSASSFSTGGASGAQVKEWNDAPTNPDQGGYTSDSSGPVQDPFAKYGGKQRYDSLVSGFDTQKQNIYGTSREAAQNAATGRRSNILDFIQSLRSGQQGIDERGVQNELGYRQGRGSILDMVGRGIRQGGTMLAGRNASDSSAAEGIARAYGDIGHRQLSGLGNQYELENRNIGLAQTDFDTQRQTGMRKFDESKMQAVNGIVSEARNRLAALDAAMVDADMPTRIELEQEREAIKSEALGILSQFDQELSGGVGGVNPMGVDERRRTAADLSTRGVAATNPFDFSATAPAQFQGTGPFASELPLFTLRNRRQEA